MMLPTTTATPQSKAWLTESWLQDVAASIKLNPLSPEVVRSILPIVDLQLRKIIQEAHKFQRRTKTTEFKGKYIFSIYSAYVQHIWYIQKRYTVYTNKLFLLTNYL